MGLSCDAILNDGFQQILVMRQWLVSGQVPIAQFEQYGRYVSVFPLDRMLGTIDQDLGELPIGLRFVERSTHQLFFQHLNIDGYDRFDFLP